MVCLSIFNPEKMLSFIKIFFNSFEDEKRAIYRRLAADYILEISEDTAIIEGRALNDLSLFKEWLECYILEKIEMDVPLAP